MNLELNKKEKEDMVERNRRDNIFYRKLKIKEYARKLHKEIPIDEWTLETVEFFDESFRIEYYHIDSNFNKEEEMKHGGCKCHPFGPHIPWWKQIYYNYFGPWFLRKSKKYMAGFDFLDYPEKKKRGENVRS